MISLGQLKRTSSNKNGHIIGRIHQIITTTTSSNFLLSNNYINPKKMHFGRIIISWKEPFHHHKTTLKWWLWCSLETIAKLTIIFSIKDKTAFKRLILDSVKNIHLKIYSLKEKKVSNYLRRTAFSTATTIALSFMRRISWIRVEILG